MDRIQLKSPGTIKNTQTYLKKFNQFTQNNYEKPNESILNEIISNKNQKILIYDLIQEYVNHLVERKIGPGSIRNNVYALKGYLRYFGFDITRESLKDNITLPRIIEESREPLQFEQLKNIVESAKPARKALYLTMATSGIRPGEAVRLRKRDFDLEKYDRIMIRLPGKITKTKKPRITFVTKETEQYLLPILKKIKDDDFVFSTNPEKPEQAKLNEEQAFIRIRDELGYTEKYDSGTHKITLGDSLRSWFVTRANRIDYGFGHALAGHDQYMKRYDRLSIDEMVSLYEKLEPDLLLFEYNKQKHKVNKSMQEEVENLKHEIKRIKLKNEISDAAKTAFLKWSEQNQDKVNLLQVAKADFDKLGSVDDLVEHFLTKHTDVPTNFKKMFENMRVRITNG